VEPRDGKRKCSRVRERCVRISGLKFSRQPTEATLDGSKPERNPGQPAKRRRKEMLTKFFVKMQNKMQDEEGQGLVEYALILVLVSIVVIIALTAIGTGVNQVFLDIGSALTGAGT
jgi:pilus assembly protein Flp/PilA